MMEYKGYIAEYEYDEEAKLLLRQSSQFRPLWHSCF